MLTHLIQRVMLTIVITWHQLLTFSYFNLLLLKHLVNCKHTLREWMMYEESSKLVPHFVLIG